VDTGQISVRKAIVAQSDTCTQFDDAALLSRADREAIAVFHGTHHVLYESQATARSCTLSRKRLGGPRTMCPLGASERIEKQCARLIRANVTAKAASLRLCHRSSSRIETDVLAHTSDVVRRPAGVAVVRHPLDPSPICRRLLGTCREADALSFSC